LPDAWWNENLGKAREKMNENLMFRSDFWRISCFFAFSKPSLWRYSGDATRQQTNHQIFVQVVEQILGEYWPGEYRQVGEIL